NQDTATVLRAAYLAVSPRSHGSRVVKGEACHSERFSVYFFNVLQRHSHRDSARGMPDSVVTGNSQDHGLGFRPLAPGNVDPLLGIAREQDRAGRRHSLAHLNLSVDGV